MATMRQGLSDFLVRLGDEPELFAEYLENRDGVMEREGVTGADRDAIIGGDLREIRARLREEYSEPGKPPVMIEAYTIMRETPPMEPEEPEELPEEPPTIMEPEELPEEPPTIMEPEEPPTIMEPEEPQAG
jgi:hypothetical protein